MDIKEIIEQLEDLMYGYHYDVCFGIDIFDGHTFEDFNKSIKAKYPDSNPYSCPLTEVTKQEFFDNITAKFDYRGDDGSCLELTEEKEADLKIVQGKYFDFIKQFVNEYSKYYYYSDAKGIPGNPVFWEYRFAVFTNNDKILFIYGSCSY
jgi:hypothetical protein